MSEKSKQFLSTPSGWRATVVTADTFRTGKTGDYCLPDVCLSPEEERPIGVYGQRRRVYLRAHHRVLYYNLLTAGALDGHLADIEEQAQELFLRLVEQYADTEGVTERLKASEPQSWVRKMNGIRNRANEAVMQEIVYR